MLNMCQILSLVTATEGPVAEFSSFVNFEERTGKSNLLIPFSKMVHQKGSFGQIRKNPLFHFCRLILDIFEFTLFKKPKLLNIIELQPCKNVASASTSNILIKSGCTFSAYEH